MISQKDCFQGHFHKGAGNGNVSGVSVFRGIQFANGDTLKTDDSTILEAVSDGIHETPRIGTETRPLNFTYKLWRRIT